MTKPTSAYVHIPFCTQICYYCDFSKVFIQNQPVDDYLAALMAEVDHYDLPALKTLYIGGGTPTALSARQLDDLLTGLEKRLDLSQLEEFTIEANPGDLDDDKIAVLKSSKCHRVSLGVQSFDDRMLRKIGRSHNRDQVYKTIESLKLAGFDNISIDLIYALPQQTMAEVVDNVDRALALAIPHLSLYSLILENHTVFMNRQRRGHLHLPTEDLESEMFDYIMTTLKANGFNQYEVANFAKPGFESRHNQVYWDNAEYYGLGAGASGYVDGVRYRNRGPIQHYLKAIREAGHSRLQEDVLTLEDKMEEQLMLGLRKKSGISIATFEKKFGTSFETVYGQVVRDLEEQGLLKRTGDQLQLTSRGLFLGDTVAERFILDKEKMSE